MTADERAAVLAAYVGDRGNRRHKPGRAFERTSYRFDVLTDYGAFRDLQRHRLLTIDWQALTPRHGFVEPEAVIEAGGDADWQGVMRDRRSCTTRSPTRGCRRSRSMRCRWLIACASSWT